jgi:hypothetical protein
VVPILAATSHLACLEDTNVWGGRVGSGERDFTLYVRNKISAVAYDSIENI